MVPQRRFGRTGLTAPLVTLGGGWVGGLLIHGDRATRFAQLDAAMAAGVDWVDTAAQYGKGVSERMIGEWLAERAGAPRPRLSTKFSVDMAAGEVEAQIRASVTASFARLGVSRVEAILLHNQIVEGGAAAGGLTGVTAEDVLAPGGLADMMDRLRADGLCDHVGFTALGDPPAAKRVAASGRFDIAQVYYNLLNPTAAEAAPPGWNTTDFDRILDACQAADVGVMAIRIFAGGFLASDRRHGREVPITRNADEAAEAARAAAALAELADETGSGAQLALRFGLAQPALSTIVIGVGEDWHFAHALEALEMGPLPGPALARLARLRAAHPAFVEPRPGG